VLSALTRRIAPVIVVVAAFYAVMIPIRINDSSVVAFIHIGRHFLDSAQTSPAIDETGHAQSDFGYDGQFYYFIAVDPSHARDYMRYGAEDQAGIRYARIGYPLAARVVVLGQRAAVPYGMLLLNVLAVLVATFAIALWLRRRGRSPWYAALYGLWPGTIYAVFRDLSEPLAYCLVALAVLVFDVHSNRRLAAAAALLALSLLTRETTIAFAVGLAFAVWFADRRLPRALVFLAAAIVPMVVWRAIVTAWLDATTIEHSGTGWKIALPFYGMRSWWPWDGHHWLIFWTVDVPFALIGIGALWLLYRRRNVPAAVLFLLNGLLFVVFIPHNVTIDWGAAGRNATPALLAALFLVPAVRNRAVALGGAALLSVLWFLLIAWSVGLRPIDLMTL
jgi:hypothetical protein